MAIHTTGLEDSQEIRTLDAALLLLRKRLHERFREDLEPGQYVKFARDIDARIDAHMQGELREDIRLVLDRVEREIARELKADLKRAAKEEEEEFQRFDIHMRIQHMLMFTSVFIVIFTGMPIKFPEFFVSEWLISVFGGVENAALLHRVGALIMVASAAYHVPYTLLHKNGRRDFLMLLPAPQDIRDVIQRLRLFLGLTDEAPKFGRFGYIEKFDYWAVYWGCMIMIGSGTVLWGQEIALRFLPLYVMNVAKEMHSDEALLATLAIVIWHFYNVHFNPSSFPGSLTWWHGKVDKHHMLEHHGLEYERIMTARQADERQAADKQEG